jgi:hypothetical protein
LNNSSIPQLPLALQELCGYPQWVVRSADKIPLRVSDGKPASPTNPADWSTYNDALECIRGNPAHKLGLGFVLSDSDPFCVVDLDTYKCGEDQELHKQIFKEFDTYTELSPSGKGAHIWCKGNTASRKAASEHVEVYSTAHYITVTGNIVHDVPIRERQHQLDVLSDQLFGAVAFPPISEPETIEANTDGEIWTKCVQAANGDKFKELWEGRWKGVYPSQSEADQALCNFCAFYTDNQKQVKRLFLKSALGKRDKATKRKNYVDNMVKKSFDQKLPAIDPQVKAILEAQYSGQFSKGIEETPTLIDWNQPPGIIGEIANFIYDNAQYPNRTIAIAGAIIFMAGICGRQYNTSTDTGLNLYIALLAETGIGKEAAASGIDKLVSAIRSAAMRNGRLVNVDKYFETSSVASEAALMRYLHEDSKCFYIHYSELGKTLQKMKHANNYIDNGVIAMFTDMFMKSGKGRFMKGRKYSDKKNNIASILSPAVSLLGDTTPDTFYEAFEVTDVENGFLPRFVVMEVKDKKSAPNDKRCEPSKGLINSLVNLLQTVGQMEATDTVVTIAMNPEGKAIADAFRDKNPESTKTVMDDLNSRSHLILLRLSHLIAIGCLDWNKAEDSNMPFRVPTVTGPMMEWSKKLVEQSVNNVAERVKFGNLGSKSVVDQQRKSVESLLVEFWKCKYKDSWANPSGYAVSREMHSNKELTFAYIQKKLKNHACFRDVDFGTAAQRILRTLEASNNVQSMELTNNAFHNSVSKHWKILSIDGL